MNYFESFDLNEEVRYNHEECGDERGRLYVRFTGHGWLVNCFNCSLSLFKPLKPGQKGEAYVKMVKKSKENADVEVQADQEEFNLPKDYTRTLPDSARQWLESYGITEEEQDGYSIGYSGWLHRLLLPIYREDFLIGYQGRYFGDQKKAPKYLTWKRKDEELYFKVNRQKNQVVVTEDILSAIKVGRQVSTLALLGSPERAGKGLILNLKPYHLVTIWLDQDKLKAALKLAAQIRLYGKKVKVVWTDKDPKAYPDKFIARKISS